MLNSLFLNEYPYRQRKIATPIKLLNKALSRLRLSYHLEPTPDPMLEMNTIEQRLNMFHLLNAVLAYKVPGEVIELGCYEGQAAILFQRVLSEYHPDRKVILFDSFEAHFGNPRSVEEDLKRKFRTAGLSDPVFIKGLFEETVPHDLPEQIAFAHIDCGMGQDREQHAVLICLLLEYIYSRMPKGAVCCLMDYNDKNQGHTTIDFNPGVKIGCDRFFTDKPETVVALYGKEYAHGYFIKN